MDAQGRTTYEIVQGSLTGSFDAPSFPATGENFGNKGFVFLTCSNHTATLVEGGDEAFVTMDLGGVGVSISCSVAGSTANCVGFDGTETITYTEDAAPITVQIDPAVTPTTAAGADGAGTTPTTGNGSPTSPTPGGTTSGDAPGPTGTNNNSAGRAATTLGWVVSACLVLAVMLH